MFLPTPSLTQRSSAVAGVVITGATFCLTILFFVVISSAYDLVITPNQNPVIVIPVESPEPYTPKVGNVITPEAYEEDAAPSPTSTLPTMPSSGAALPERMLLDVPFSSQAPYGRWVQPYEDACEETSVLMARDFLHGETGNIPASEADRLILELTAFEEEQYGIHHSTSLAETKRFAEAFFPELTAEILPVTDADSVRRLVADGHPVLLPLNGREVDNPHFQNGGPPYHMLVVRGYTPTQFITNDPGTRHGEGFTYTVDDLLDAVHDWNGGDVRNGARVMMVLRLKTGNEE